MSKGRGLIIGIVAITFLFSISLISAGFGYNVETSGTDININIRDSATNITDMGDVNSSMVPGGGEALIWDSGKKVWTSDSVASASDTNESTRFGNLVTTDCSGTDKVTGVQANGTVLCAADAGGSGNPFDQSLNTTDNVQFKNLTLSDTITFSLGEIIDNLVNSWIKVTGNLRVTGNLEVQGNVISNGSANFTLQDLNNTGAGITDTNESTRVHNIVNTTCAGQVVAGFYENGTAICETDDTGTGGKSTNGFYVYNDSANIYFNETQLNATIDARDTTVNNNGITLVEANITDLTHTTDTDTNASTVCGGEETLLGNSSCMNSTLFEGTHTVIWDATFNTSFDQRDSDTIYTAGTNLSLVGTEFSVNISQLTQYFNTLYQAIGSYIANNTGGWTLNFTKIYSKDWSNVTITESQITDLTHTTDTNTFYNQDLNTSANVSFYNLTISNNATFNLFEATFSGLISVTSNYIDTRNIKPRINASYDIGAPTNRYYRDLYLDGNIYGNPIIDTVRSKDWTNVTITENQITDLSHTVISSNIAYENETNTFVPDQNFSNNVSIKTNNRYCANTACTSYILNNGTNLILQG